MADFHYDDELDLGAGREARDEGVDKIKERRKREVEAIKGIILRVGRHMEVFSADDIRVRVGFPISHGNIVGAAFTGLSHTKPPTIRHVGYTQSKAVKAHARTIKTWSLAE